MLIPPRQSKLLTTHTFWSKQRRGWGAEHVPQALHRGSENMAMADENGLGKSAE